MTDRKPRKKTTATKAKPVSPDMNASVLGSVYVTLHELIGTLYNNDKITEREHDHLVDLLGGGKKAIAASKRNPGARKP